MRNWLDILRAQASSKGQAAVARELGCAKSTVCQLLSGKYPADTGHMEARVLGLYGSGGLVACPVLGLTEPGICADNYERAKRIGLRAGNPETLKLFKACLNCTVRKGGRS
jgi:hypothetical protein